MLSMSRTLTLYEFTEDLIVKFDSRIISHACKCSSFYNRFYNVRMRKSNKFNQ